MIDIKMHQILDMLDLPDLVLARRVCTYLHSTSVNMNYMILHVDLNVHVYECRLAVYPLAVAELDSSLAPLSETSGK